MVRDWNMGKIMKIPGKKSAGPKQSAAPGKAPAAMRNMHLAILAVIVLLTGALLYAYVVPRTTMQVETLFHQSFSGNSIGVRMKNTGTLDISNISVDVEVFDMDGESIHHPDPIRGIDIDAHESYEFSTSFRGSQIVKYKIVINLTFESDGEEYDETIRHTTSGEFMNENWKDRLP